VRWPAAVVAMAVGVVAAGGCRARATERAREYVPDMVRGPAYKAFMPNPATRDGLTLQAPVAGTIARGGHPFHYGPGEQEAARAGRELTNPWPASPAVLHDGRGLYQTYCRICHGERGKGDGPLAGKIPPPASYTSMRVVAFPPGRLFHVLTLGSNKMPSYAAQLSTDERWKVVAYVHGVLQGLREPAIAQRPGEGGTP
jgi:mono/diheme cytochrome c family protein